MEPTHVAEESVLNRETEALLKNRHDIFPKEKIEGENPQNFQKWNIPKAIYVFGFITLYFWGAAFVWPMIVLRFIEIFEDEGFSMEEASAKAVVMSGWLTGIQYFGSFLAGPVYGDLSDRFGRKPFIGISMCVWGMCIAAYIVGQPFWIVFTAKFISAFTDSFWTMSMVVTFDVTPPDQQAFGFGIFSAILGSSLVGFPLLAGWVSDYYGIVRCFEVGLVITGVSFLLFLGLPETKQELSTKPISWNTFNPFLQYGMIFRSKSVMVLTFASVLVSFGGEGLFDVFTTWAQYTFPQLSYFILGSLTGAYGLGMVLSGPLTKFVVPILGDETSIILSILSGAISTTITTFVTQWYLLYPLLIFRALSVISTSVMQAVIFQEFEEEERSILVGVLVSVRNIPSFLGPFFFPPIFAHFIVPPGPIIPAIPFYIIAGIYFLSFVITLSFFWSKKFSKRVN